MLKKMVGKNRMWTRTNDIYGHKRNFTHTCSACGHDKMIFRHSNLRPERNRLHTAPGPVNEIAFKCARCSLVDPFKIDDTKKYIAKILDLRDGVALYLPPKKVWASENKEIKKRLESLNYI